jgi:hypothetical protein
MKKSRRIKLSDVSLDFTRKHPIRRSVNLPVIPKSLKTLLRQLDISAFSPLGVNNVKKHLPGINIFDSQPGNFRSSQAAIIAKIDHSSETDIRIF